MRLTAMPWRVGGDGSDSQLFWPDLSSRCQPAAVAPPAASTNCRDIRSLETEAVPVAFMSLVDESGESVDRVSQNFRWPGCLDDVTRVAEAHSMTPISAMVRAH